MKFMRNVISVVAPVSEREERLTPVHTVMELECIGILNEWDSQRL